MDKSFISKVILILGGALLVGGFFFFEKYKFTAGGQVEAPDRFPSSLKNQWLDASVPTLLLFAHPKCTCTQATLVELRKLKSTLGDKISVKIFISYDQRDFSPEHAKVEAQARGIASVEVTNDIDRVVAKEFGALTSGQTMLYAPEGNLLFQGGITESRGHEGDNPGSREITRIVSSPYIINSHGRTPTFGCHL